MRIVLHIALGFMLLLCLRSLAQDSLASPLKGYGAEAVWIAGKVIKHEKKFTLPIPALTTGLDADLVFHTYGRHDWQQRRHYPVFGLGFTYINYGIESVYGRFFGLYPNMALPLLARRRLLWTLRIGDGIGYVTRKYQRTAPVDTINVAIGSHLNDYAVLMSDLRYALDARWELMAGFNAEHISDGSVHKPNLGINMVGLHAGLQYCPAGLRPGLIKKPLKPLPDRWLVQARLGMAFVSSYTAGGPLYPVYIASGYASRRWLSRNKAFAGIDYASYPSIYAWLRNNEMYTGRERQHSWKSAVFAGNEFLFGRLGLLAQVGYYLQQSAIPIEPFYEKVGGQFYLVQKEQGPIKELCLSVLLKTHETVAEFIETGIGFGF